MYTKILYLALIAISYSSFSSAQASEGNGHYSRCYDDRGEPQVIHGG